MLEIDLKDCMQYPNVVRDARMLKNQRILIKNNIDYYPSINYNQEKRINHNNEVISI